MDRARRERWGVAFGDAANPLLVSVRSGAPVSMPGMMDTILNLGLNRRTVRRDWRAVTGDAEFAADCLRRFREGYRRCDRHGRNPRRPVAAAACRRSKRSSGPGIPIGLALTAQREGIADDLGTARHGPGHGLRQSRRGLGDRSRVHAQPVHGRDRTCTGTSCSTPRARTWSPARTRREPIAVLDSRLPDGWPPSCATRIADVLERH